jgi:hypothetical protein
MTPLPRKSGGKSEALDTGLVVPADRDNGGKRLTALQASMPIHWQTSPEEAGKLGGAECMLELAVGDLETAIEDLEATDRPGWVKEARALRRRAEKLRAAITAELGA